MTGNFLKYLFVAALITMGQMIHAQLVIDNGVTPNQAVEDILLGDGVQIFNITFSGDDNQIGSFNSDNSNIGIGNGVVIATGDVDVSIGPNNAGGTGLGGGNFGAGDPDLTQLSTFETNDAAILEFDFIPTGDSVVFNYVFASEEYNEYVCGTVNDAFGFFLSGPGINGPFSDNAENIAIVPGTDIPVTINTVNLGVSGVNGTPAQCAQVSPDWDQNSAFYIDNENNNDPNSTQFDGLTVTLTAMAVVDCGETYHIKIAIADAGDTAFDSAVFLEAESFSSNAVNITADASIADAPVFLGDSVLLEGCNEAVIRLIRANSSEEEILNFEYGGSAIPDVDYPALPETVTMEAGVNEIEIPISAVLDPDAEGPEDITISYEYINDCGDTSVVTESLYIFDYIFPNIEGIDAVSDCPGLGVDISTEVLSGYTPFLWDWSSGDSTAVATVNPLETTTYTVTATDVCGETTTTDVTVTVNPPPALTLNTTDVTIACPGDLAVLTVDVSGGVPFYNYIWSNFDFFETTTVFPEATETFTVTVSDQCSQEETAEITVFVTEYDPLEVIGNGGSSFCPGDQVDLTSSATGGLTPYNFNWSNGAGSGADATVSPFTSTTYTVTVTDGCGITATDTALVDVAQYAPITILGDTVCSGAGQVFDIIGGTGNFTYTLDTISELYFTINDGGELDNYSTSASTPAGIYEIGIIDDCLNVGIHEVEVIICETLIPNVFTPGDGNDENNTFQIPGIENFLGSRFVVFNRWGNMVFEDKSYRGNWDGRDDNGNDLAEGTYFYILERSDGENFSGSVTIFR